MKMDSFKMKKELESRLSNGKRTITYDRNTDELRIENVENGKGITIALSGIIAKWELEKDRAIEEVVYYVEQGLQAMEQSTNNSEADERHIFPVIRSTSFPTESEENNPFLTEEHTAETRIYYALDLGATYRLIDEKLIQARGWSKERVKEIALFNVRSLSTQYKKDSVAGNDFYFVNPNDGYDASRVLNEAFLKQMQETVQGDMVSFFWYDFLQGLSSSRTITFLRKWDTGDCYRPVTSSRFPPPSKPGRWAYYHAHFVDEDTEAQTY